jgi:hypothetical protein
MGRREQTLVTLGLLAFSLFFVVQSASLSRTAGSVPLTVAVLTAILVAAQLWLDARKPRPAPPAPAGKAVNEKPMLLALAGLLCGLYLVGFPVALSVFTGVFWWKREGSWRGALIAGAIVGAVVGLVVSWLPGIRLQAGLLGEWALK